MWRPSSHTITTGVRRASAAGLRLDDLKQPAETLGKARKLASGGTPVLVSTVLGRRPTFAKVDLDVNRHQTWSPGGAW